MKMPVSRRSDRPDATCELLLGGGAAGAVDVERVGITRLTDPDGRFEWIAVEFGDEPLAIRANAVSGNVWGVPGRHFGDAPKSVNRGTSHPLQNPGRY
jgi:hypothetical protein